jgi:hypothetical protein
MKTTHFVPWHAALAAASLCLVAAPLEAATRLLPFQGRVTDADGNALPDGSRVVQFKIYDAPIGGLAVWNGEVHNLTINGGLVSTLLGSKAALDGVDFNLDLYLEITIDANTDGQISLSDPPLLPRQSILPAVFAWESADSQLLQGYDWSALFGPDNPADGTLLPAKIADSSLATAKLGDSAVTAAKIANGAVTRPKIDTTGASAGQSLTYDGTSVVWNQVNALNAETLDGFDWATIFTGANPASGTLNVASVASRGSVSAASDLSATGTLTVGGRSFLNGPSTTVSGALTAVNITSTTDITAFRAVWAQSFNQTSDRDAKENFSAIAPGDVLAKVATLPIARWNYRTIPTLNTSGPFRRISTPRSGWVQTTSRLRPWTPTAWPWPLFKDCTNW